MMNGKPVVEMLQAFFVFKGLVDIFIIFRGFT